MELEEASAKRARVAPPEEEAIPVVGMHQVVGSKLHRPTKLIERPPHQMPPATWHLSPDLEAKGPLDRAQLEQFYRDGFLFIPGTPR